MHPCALDLLLWALFPFLPAAPTLRHPAFPVPHALRPQPPLASSPVGRTVELVSSELRLGGYIQLFGRLRDRLCSHGHQSLVRPRSFPIALARAGRAGRPPPRLPSLHFALCAGLLVAAAACVAPTLRPTATPTPGILTACTTGFVHLFRLWLVAALFSFHFHRIGWVLLPFEVP